MRKIWMPIITVVLAAVILLGLYNGLAGVREYFELHDLSEKASVMFPGNKVVSPETYTGEDSNIRRVWKVDTGYLVETVTGGYAGDITMLIGVSNDGTVTGLQVRNMEETYGLGAKALTDWEFLAQFLRSEGDVQVGTDVDALTGATVTSKAIARSVNSAVSFVTGADTSSAATSWGG